MQTDQHNKSSEHPSPHSYKDFVIKSLESYAQQFSNMQYSINHSHYAVHYTPGSTFYSDHLLTFHISNISWYIKRDKTIS